ncbi:MAG TPA: UbiA family prenyltransferase [Candidatus Limnocylindrales bacterium]|nr:UbiA family prenyltransferase [Candidatus Limnocylindrales bacterium]
MLALVAGASLADAILLGVAMTSLQAAIGAGNDVVDAPADAVAKPAKPIPSGLVSHRLATFVGGAATAIGIGLSATVGGLGTVPIAVAILAVGFAYDLWFKGTAWSWLPFAVGIPILPVYAWYGATGGVPEAFAVLIPAAVAAGAALAIGNARADRERDVASGVASIATVLGAERAWAIEVALIVTVGAVAVISAGAAGASVGRVAIVGLAALVPIAAVLGSANLEPSGRERAWEAEAVGVALLAVVWVWVAVA